MLRGAPDSDASLVVGKGKGGGGGGGGSAEEHRHVTADVVEAVVAGVDVLVVADARQEHEDKDEARLHDEPG